MRIRAAVFLFTNHMWILKIPNYADVFIYHTGRVKDLDITDNRPYPGS